MKIRIDEYQFILLCEHINHCFSDEALREIYTEINKPVYYPDCDLKSMLNHFEETKYGYPKEDSDFCKVLECGSFLYGRNLSELWDN